VLHGEAEREIPALANQLKAQAVFAAKDYEPQALARDNAVRKVLLAQGIQLAQVKDHVIFEEREVLTQAGKPYGVFTPYLRSWLARLADKAPVEQTFATPCRALAPRPADYAKDVPSLKDIGFEPTNLPALAIPTGASGAARLLQDFLERMDRYDTTRNFPAIKGPSYLGVHLRFGTVSIRQLVTHARRHVAKGSTGAETWLSELAWRDFYFQILANFPHVATGSFKPEYDAIQWEEGARAQELFTAWCERPHRLPAG